MNLQLTGQFFALTLMLAMTPGADWAYAIASGAGGRLKQTFLAITGMLAGHLFNIVLVVVGLGVLVTGNPVALNILTFAGACFLFYLGATTLLGLRRSQDPVQVAAQEPTQAPTQETEPDGDTKTRARSGIFTRGFAVSSLNPKGHLLLIALLPQFVTTDGWPMEIQMIVLGIVLLTTCAIIYPAVAFGAQKLLAARPQAAQVVTAISGIVMLLLGAGLIYDALSG